jgi:AbrB family looped-hinge helix DNA binding protein
MGLIDGFNPFYNAIMNARLVMDKAGRIVIPKPLRQELHLEPGDSLELESGGEQITLRPARGTGLRQNEHGIWVLHTGEPLPACATDDLLQYIREERDLSNLSEGFVENASLPARKSGRKNRRRTRE